MRIYILCTILFTFLISNSQTINLNESHIIDYLRTSQLIGKLDSDFSFSVRPLSIDSNNLNIDSLFIYSGVHRNEFRKDEDLSKLFKKYNVKTN